MSAFNINWTIKAQIKLNFISDKDKSLLGINPENPKIRKVIEVRCDKLFWGGTKNPI